MTVRMVIAYVLYYFGIVGVFSYVLVSYVVRNKIASCIFASDLKVSNKIIPSCFSWLRNILGFAFIACVVIGLAIGNEDYTGIVFMSIVYLFLGALMLKDACTQLVLRDEHIVITVLQKNRQYLRSDICTIEWKTCRGIIGKQLVIVFCDGRSYYFNMDYYRGVQNTYNELTGLKT